VKLVDVGGHNRLELEIALAPHLPSGLGAPLLSSGRRRMDTCDVRYACFTRMPGASPGVGLPYVNAATARRWAEQAVRWLDDLHTWTPTGAAEQALKESSVHEGFTGRAALMTEIDGILAADRDTVIPRPLIDGLSAIAENAPLYAGADVPVHADTDWGNWLADDQNVTALLDFERARFGVPADDWVLLAVHSGPHSGLVLDVIAEQTASSLETVRAECEIRYAAFIAEDLRQALELPDVPPWMARRLHDLERLVTGRRWWQPAR
jgi:aminoglycoside phosphotransferase (APT) family kinase protein